MTDSNGVTLKSDERERLVQWALSHRRLVGNRRWGMLVLYYRAGLTHADIAEVFGVPRQTVSYELKRAMELVEHDRQMRRRYARRPDSPE